MKNKRMWASLHPFFEEGGVLGRSVANAEFLAALLRADPFDEYHFFLQDQAGAKTLESILHARFPEAARRGAFTATTRHALPEALRGNEYTCFHLSDCVADTVPLMRLRASLHDPAAGDGRGRQFFPITGPTHSLSYARYAPFFFAQLWEGVTRRDAMIVTSRAAEEAMARYFETHRKGYGLTESAFPAPRLERIALGVDPASFHAPAEKALMGAALRAKLGIAEDELILLVFARISHFSKMDLLPLFRALARAYGMGLDKDACTLLVAGWVEEGDEMPATYARLAASQGIRMRVVASPSDEERASLFAAADIFLSPVDNPQETFGLSLLEAGVSSLPSIVSDFDGYRDLVVDQETGVLVPTLGPAATPESDALSGIWFDNQYHLQLAQQSVVDVPFLASSLARLASDPARRRAMGEAARKRVLENFTWDHCVRRHLALWEELWAEAPPSGPIARHPLFPGYAEVFGGYYSTRLAAPELRETRVRWSRAGEAVYRGLDFPVIYAGIERLVAPERLKKLLFAARRPIPLANLLPAPEAAHSPEYEQAAFLVLWALKQDYLERAANDGRGDGRAG